MSARVTVLPFSSIEILSSSRKLSFAKLVFLIVCFWCNVVTTCLLFAITVIASRTLRRSTMLTVRMLTPAARLCSNAGTGYQDSRNGVTKTWTNTINGP